MEIITGTVDSFSAEMLFDMARYRHRVFVEKLGWDLDTRARFELDEFDRKDTAYLIARNAGGQIVGTGRLLPTHRPYLLATVFPELLGSKPAPCSPKIWELSRFAAMDLDAQPGATREDLLGTSLALEMLSVAMRTVAQKGARRLVSVSPLVPNSTSWCATSPRSLTEWTGVPSTSAPRAPSSADVVASGCGPRPAFARASATISAVRRAVPLGASTFPGWCSSMISVDSK